MTSEPTQIDAQLLDRARRLAAERHCSVDEILREALDRVERPLQSSKSLIGLFADVPDLVDQVLEDVYRTREQGILRLPSHG